MARDGRGKRGKVTRLGSVGETNNAGKVERGNTRFPRKCPRLSESNSLKLRGNLRTEKLLGLSQLGCSL